MVAFWRNKLGICKTRTSANSLKSALHTDLEVFAIMPRRKKEAPATLELPVSEPKINQNILSKLPIPTTEATCSVCGEVAKIPGLDANYCTTCGWRPRKGYLPKVGGKS